MLYPLVKIISGFSLKDLEDKLNAQLLLYFEDDISFDHIDIIQYRVSSVNSHMIYTAMLTSWHQNK